MTQVAQPEVQYTDRIKLPFTFDEKRLEEELRQMNLRDFEYYNVIPLRSPAHLVDTSRPFPPPAEDYADGSWTPWLDTPELKGAPYYNEVINFFKEHTTVNLVRILRLAPESEVAEHTDPTLALEEHKSMIRLTIPIVREPDVDFFLNGTTVPLQPGECWYMRLSDPHKVVNKGSRERISLTIDMIPNDWVKEAIEKAMNKTA